MKYDVRVEITGADGSVVENYDGHDIHADDDGQAVEKFNEMIAKDTNMSGTDVNSGKMYRAELLAGDRSVAERSGVLQ